MPMGTSRPVTISRLVARMGLPFWSMSYALTLPMP
jgi:hypothetical protein